MQDPGRRIQPLYGAFRRPASRSSRARAEGGTGLGLAIVKHLMGAHGGLVTAASEHGAGTTVTCWFPAA